MDENTTTKNEELEEEEEIVADEEIDDADLDEDIEDEADDINEDEDFEYDEDGNIVIPDDEDDDADEGDEEAKADDTDDGEGSEKPDDAKADDNTDGKSKEAESELNKIKAQARETLEKLGVKIESDDDVLAGLVKLAAEAEDTTPEEYLKQKAEAEKLEAAKQLIAQQEGERIRKADLDEIHKFFPETSEYTDISQIPNFKRFGELRIKGLSAEEAYSATHANAIRANAAAGAKRQSLNDTKNHLKTTVPAGAKDNAITMSKKDLSEWREIFPGMSDKEIAALYKKTAK